MNLRLPHRFGRYELVTLLGEGGMAEVYRASVRVAAGLTKWVVIKKIRQEFAQQAEFRSMFVQEAKIALSLSHANIVHVFDFGQIGSAYYLAMELIEGVDLMHVFATLREKQEPFPPVIAAYIVHQIASGIGYVHRKSDDYGQALGIVHRDISPHNVMLSYDGQVKLLDFGIARSHRDIESSERADQETIKGKVAYMSPEQAAGKTVDQRSDIYSMGIVLYELLTGQPLFREADRLKALERVRHEKVPPLLEQAPDLPLELAEIVEKALERDVQQRTASARDLQAQLASFLHRADPVVDDETLSRFLQLHHPRNLPTEGTRDTQLSHEPATQDLSDSQPSVEIGVRRRRAKLVLLAAHFSPTQDATVEVRSGDVERFCGFIQRLGFQRDAEVLRLDKEKALLAFGTIPTSQDEPEQALRTAQSLRQSIGEMVPGMGLGIVLMSTPVEMVNSGGGESFSLPAGLSDQLFHYAERFVDDRVMASRAVVEPLQKSWRFGPFSPIHSGYSTHTGAMAWAADFQELAPLQGPLSETERRDQLQRAGRQPLLGRELELKTLRDTLAQAIRELRSHTVLIRGGAGMGKRALVERFISSLPPSSCVVLRGTGLWAHRNQPLTLFLDVIARFFHIKTTTPAQELVSRLKDYAIQDAESLGLAAAAAMGLSGASRQDHPIVEQRDQIVRLVRRLIRSLSARRPVLLVVDGMHFVDEESVNILEDWAKKRPAFPVLGILSGRWNARLEQHFEPSGAVKLRLSELGERARRQMILRRFAAPQNAHELCETIVAHTGGNPLFIEETLASLLRRNIIGWAPDGRHWVVLNAKGPVDLPPTVEATLQRRLDALEDRAREVLQACAVLGRRFRPAELPGILTDIDAATIEKTLEQLVAEGLCLPESVPGPDGGTRMRFSTLSLHDVARRGVPASHRTHLHSFAARAKSQRADYLQGRDDGPIAEHLLAAGHVQESIEPALRAARYAKQVSGFSEAYHHLSQALKALPEDDPRRFSALLEREPILRSWGHKRARGTDIRQLIDFARRFGLEEHRALATIRLLRFYIDCGWYRRGERLLPEIEGRIAALDNPRPYRAQLGELVSSLQFYRREFQASHQTAERALEDCDDDGPGQRQRGRLLILMGQAELGSGQFRAAQLNFQTCLQLARDSENRRLEAEALNHLGSAAGLMTRYQEAVEFFHKALDIDRELGDRHATGTKLANLGIAYTAIGLYRRAERYLRKALELHEAVGHPGQLHDVMISLGDAVLGLGDPLAAQRIFGDAEAIARNLDDTRKELRATARLAAAMIHPDSSPAELEQAEILAKRVVQEGQARGFSTAAARGWRILATLADREGRRDEAILLERRAVDLVRQGAAPLEGVFSLHHLGRLLSDDPETQSEGEELLREAADIVFGRLSTLSDPDLREGYTRQPAVREILEDGGRTSYTTSS